MTNDLEKALADLKGWGPPPRIMAQADPRLQSSHPDDVLAVTLKRHSYDTIIADLQAALTQPRWQDISTAPRDGTWIRLRGGLIDYEWNFANRPPEVVGQWTTELNGSVVDGHWQFAWYDGGYYGEYENPKEWQPVDAT